MIRRVTAALATTAAGAILAIIGTSSPAQAQDTQSGGFYIGVTGGYGFGEADVKGDLLRDHSNPSSQVVSEDGKGDLEGGMIGGLVGFDYALGNGLVIGAVGDLSWLNATGNADVEPSVINLTGSDYDVDTSLSWLGTLRGRVGFEMGDVLVYGTGGLAFGGVDADLSVSGSGEINSDSNTQVGWTVGGGVNYMATDNVMLGVEYLYVDLGEGSYQFGDTGDADIDLNMSIVRGTVSFKF
ncbi:outer membrane protein [Aestuariivirga sp.]|jgi:outer membrane immunogenic protein|uniref:outer membrane protein n=1 Tax=Aestuariivirga sp. TaxID=2650926 RepID=UPI003784BAC3